MDYYSSNNQQQDCQGSFLPNINYYINAADYGQGLNVAPQLTGHLMPINALNGQMCFEPMNSTGAGGQNKRRMSDVGDPSKEDQLANKKSRNVNPFSPECSIPLPFQLGDEFGYYGPVSIWKRNERERHRVRCVNDGYEKLRSNLPFFDKEKRLSKVETLRLAIRYIRHLQKLLANADHNETCNCHLEEHATAGYEEMQRTSENGGSHKITSDDSDCYDDASY